MKKEFNYILLVIVFVAMAMMLNGCGQKYQSKEEVSGDGLNVTITGLPDNLEIVLLSPAGTYSKKSIEKIVMTNGPVVVYLPFYCLGIEGTPCSFKNNVTKKGVYTLLIQKSESEKIVFKKTIELIGVNETVRIAQATERAGL